MISGFFDNTTVESEDFATFVRGILTNGVTGDNEDVLKVTAAGGMKVNVAPGYAWINGHFGRIDTPETLTVYTADGSMPRIDRIVARLDLSIPSIRVDVKKGTAAESPVAPPPVRNGTIYDLILADITVPAGATSITTANIKDTRADKVLCGSVLANTKESLALDGKADQSALEALESSVSADITRLYSRRLAGKDLISEPITGGINTTGGVVTGTAVIDQEMTGYGLIRLTGSVSMRKVVSGEATELTASYEMNILGVGDNSEKEIIIKPAESGSETIGGDTAAWKVMLSQTASAAGITLTAEVSSPESSSTGNYIISSLVINTARAVYLE